MHAKSSERKRLVLVRSTLGGCRIGAMPLMLSSAFLFGLTPVEASEVVKLARLVITGKRLNADQAAAEKARTQQLPRVVVEGERSTDGRQFAAQPRGLVRAL